MRWTEPFLKTHPVIDGPIGLIDVCPLTPGTGDQLDEGFVPSLRIVAPVLHIDIEPSISLIEIESTDAHCEHELIGADCVVDGVDLFEVGDFGVDIDFVESVDGGAGEDGDEHDDHDHGASTPCEGFVFWLVVVAEGDRLREQIECFEEFSKFFHEAHLSFQKYYHLNHNYHWRSKVKGNTF